MVLMLVLVPAPVMFGTKVRTCEPPAFISGSEFSVCDHFLLPRFTERNIFFYVFFGSHRKAAFRFQNAQTCSVNTWFDIRCGNGHRHSSLLV